MKAWEYYTSEKQWKSYLQDLLRENDKALYKAIVLIYNRQTEEERSKGESTEDNHVGFSKVDADIMGKIALKILSDKSLTPGELAMSRNKMCKYWKQLMFISKQKTEERRAKIAEQKAEEERKRKEAEQRQFIQHIEEYARCKYEGIQCEYGICSECKEMW